jgi:hypothetical protein
MPSIVAHLRRFVVVPQVTLCVRAGVQRRGATATGGVRELTEGPSGQSMLAIGHMFRQATSTTL